MANLVVIVGPPASGKAAVGLALSQLTGFRLFHNHMTAEPVAALFGWGTAAYGEVASQVRLSLLDRALAEPNMTSIVFTFVWAFDLEEDCQFIVHLVELVQSKGKRVFFVELLASLEARIAREGTPLRLALKPAKHDVERARAFHLETDGKHRMNSANDFPYPDNYLVVDTEALSPSEAALKVAQHFGFLHADT